jgi:hypothetical protein
VLTAAEGRAVPGPWSGRGESRTSDPGGDCLARSFEDGPLVTLRLHPDQQRTEFDVRDEIVEAGSIEPESSGGALRKKAHPLKSR